MRWSAIPAAAKSKFFHAYGRRPLAFEANRGQTDPQVRFLARGRGYTLFLTATDAVLALRKTPALRMRLIGANPAPEVHGFDELSGKSHYFIGGNPEKWRVNVANYARVRYRAVYPGVDLVYYGRQGQLEYDFVVAPGADPSGIRLAFDGADDLEIDGSGDLVLRAEGGEVRLRRPLIYQEKDGARRKIRGGYVLLDRHQVGLRVAAYDASQRLVVDPVLVYSTYLGGSGEEDPFAAGVAVDAQGHVYVTGSTRSADFPTTAGSYDGSCGTDGTCNGNLIDVFVAKFDPTLAGGASLVYSTYLGGLSAERGYDIAVDAAGSAYVAGATGSVDDPSTPEDEGFPATPGAYQKFEGSPPAFVTKLSPDGSSLIYSTALGGSGDRAQAITVDTGGHAFVTGETGSIAFPTTPGAYFRSLPQPIGCTVCGSGTFVTKLSTDGSALVYSTYLGTHAGEGRGIAVDAAGRAYVTGKAQGNMPTVNAFQSNAASSDAFLTIVNPDGSALVYSTYLGGSDQDEGVDVAVDRSGRAYVTGWTLSTDFPTRIAVQPASGGNIDAFVAKIDPSRSGDASLVYSTYLGGYREEKGTGIAVDAFGVAYVAGHTNSPDFATVDPVQGVYGGGGTCAGGHPCRDAFVTKLNHAGNAALYSTYLGGSGEDSARSIAVDAFGNAYLAGNTGSADFPITAAAFDGTCGTDGICNGTFDLFVAKLGSFTTGIPVAWGSNGRGQLGNGLAQTALTPVLTSGLTNVIAVSGGPLFSLALKTDGTVWSWGRNFSGQLGDGSPIYDTDTGATDRKTPVQVVDPGDPTGKIRNVVAVSAGGFHSLALKTDGTVWAWGENTTFQLGDGCTSNCVDRSTPARVVDPSDPSGFLTKVVAIAAGGFHNLALKADGSVWTWGAEPLGNGILRPFSSVPVQVTGVDHVVAIAASRSHSLALNADGTVWAWGGNANGQLGDGGPLPGADRGTPAQVVGLTDIVAIAAGLEMSVGGDHSLALRADGTVWAWGENAEGQLGDGDVLPGADSSSPVQVVDSGDPSGFLSAAVAIAADGDHNLALKVDGRVFAWGANGTGQLGDGSRTPRSSAEPVHSLINVRAIGAGGYHSVATIDAQPASNGLLVGSGGAIVATSTDLPADTMGAAVIIPPTALSSDTVVGVTELGATDPSLPAPPPNSLSRVIELTPAGQVFAVPVSIVFAYDDAEVAGKDEASLQVNLLLGAGYVTVPDCVATDPPNPDPCVSARNTTGNTVTVATTHFTVYALSAPPSNHPPIANAGPDQIVECVSPFGATVNLDGSGSHDPDGDPLSFTWFGPSGIVTEPTLTAAFPLGVSTASLTVSDGIETASDIVTISVLDTTPPEISSVPGPISVGQSALAGTPVQVPLPAATDRCSPTVAVNSDAPMEFPLGTTTVVFTATDESGNAATATTTVTVVEIAGRMHGSGYIDATGARHLFEFRVRDRATGLEGGRLSLKVQERRRRHNRHRHHGHDQFESTTIAPVVFSDDPAITPGRRRGPRVDTVEFAGTGRWNRQPGYTFEARATDAGEPGRRRDAFAITIRDPSGAVVSSLSGLLSGGNIQSQRQRR